jgi:hypothetical protein
MSTLAPEYIRSQIETLKSTNPDIWDGDDSMLADMLEGETDLFEFLTAATQEIDEAEAFAETCNLLISKYKRRKERLEHRVERLRDLMLKLLQESGLKTHKLATTTLSVRNGPRKVIVTNESELPDEYFRITRKPNLTAIHERIDQGVAVPGAVLSNAQPVLSMT